MEIGPYLDSLDKLWRIYHKSNGDKEYSRNKLLEACLPIMKPIINRCVPNYNFNDEEDLIQEGIFGAIDAIDDFDPNRKVRFATYLNLTVKRSIIEYLRSQGPLSSLFRARKKQLEQAKKQLRNRLFYEPSQEQILEELADDKYVPNPTGNRTKFSGEKKARAILKSSRALTRIRVFPLNNVGPDFKKSTRYIIDNKKIKYLTEEQSKYFKDAILKRLTKRERSLIMSYYYENMSMKKIGEMLEVTESRISQLHKKIILNLKLRLKGSSLEDFQIPSVK